MQGEMTVTVTSLINGETRPGAGGDMATTTSAPEVRDLSKTLNDVGDSYYCTTTGHWSRSEWPWYTSSALGQSETSNM